MIDMKNSIKYLCSAFLVSAALLSCKKEENKVFFQGGTAPVLTVSSTADMVLDTTNAAKTTAIVFNWTNPEYNFNTGISSQTITYILQIDSAGANFSSPNIQEVAVSGDLRLVPTVKVFNGYINKAGLKYDMPHEVEFRIKASISDGSAADDLYSNVIKIKITPYLDVAVPVPTDGTLWAVGSAFASGWDNPTKDPYTSTMQFTKVSETLYELVVDFLGGGNFKLIQKQGEWSSQYRPKYSADVPFDSGDFERRDADPGWNGPAAAGRYKITVDFITGKYKITKQ